ncbi:hypothetical protein Gasu2_33550 [Galdieria sulphuraria]|nr:hypothetical protein Gasu2_33550 [Galdieria sulphuraria]
MPRKLKFSPYSGDRNQVVQTPPEFYSNLNDLVSLEGGFQFDPCPVEPDFDGLEIEWKDGSFVNPPYNDLCSWFRKGLQEAKLGHRSVFLVPFRPQNAYFADLIFHRSPSSEELVRLILIHGKIKFVSFNAAFPELCVILSFFSSQTKDLLEGIYCITNKGLKCNRTKKNEFFL